MKKLAILLFVFTFMISCTSNYHYWKLNEGYKAAKENPDYSKRQGFEGRMNTVFLKNPTVDFILILETYDTIKITNNLPLFGFQKVFEFDVKKGKKFKELIIPGYYFVSIKIGSNVFPMEGQPFRPAECVDIKPYFESIIGLKYD